MKSKRIMTGVIGFPIVAILLIFGNKYLLDIVFSAVAMLALNEFFNAFRKIAKPIKWTGYLFCIVIAFIHIIPIQYLSLILIMIIPIIIGILFLQVIITNLKITIIDIAITLLGICYVAGFTLFIPLILGMQYGKIFVWYILISAWGTDTFAYFTGIKLGKNKLTPISPKKSIEGSIGGIIGSTIVMIIYTIIVNKCFNMQISYIFIFFLSIVLSVLSQIGDLTASSIKRYTGIKDFGDLIPGHGGLLDRIDSIIFIAPFVYAFFSILS